MAGARIGRAHEPLGIHGRPVLVVLHERRERRGAGLANAARAGEVHHDAEEVGAQGRAALELVEAAEQADPGFLGDVLGDLLGGDVLTRHAHERGVVELDEPLEGPLVAGAQSREQGRFLAAVCGRLLTRVCTVPSLHRPADVTPRGRRRAPRNAPASATLPPYDFHRHGAIAISRTSRRTTARSSARTRSSATGSGRTGARTTRPRPGATTCMSPRRARGRTARSSTASSRGSRTSSR